MDNKAKKTVNQTKRYGRFIEKQTGKAIRPYCPKPAFRDDGFVNFINKYGTQMDTTENYKFQRDDDVLDEQLTEFYEGDGLFAKIIDAPAEEAIKHGFELDDVSDQAVIDFCTEALDELDWEETAMNALKWSRLFGGSIIVMLINDGRGIDEPLDWSNIQSIDDLRVYDRSLIQPDLSTLFSYERDDPFRTRASRLGTPERYHVYSKYGNFTVHESRCLLFPNGTLPENTTHSNYEFWGIPEYVRIRRAIRDTELSHSIAPKMLDRSVQAVYKMKDLAQLLATEDGEDIAVQRMQMIDLARGLLSSIILDADGEEYDFKQFQYNGVSDVIDTTCNYLSAITNIPQTILFGRSPAGMNSTGESDLENWYSFVGRIQKRTVKNNLRYLLSIIFQAGVATGEIDEIPKIKISFNPLWTTSEDEKADLELKKAQIQQTKAATAQMYIDMQAIDPTEVRRKLADSEEFDIESMLDEYDISDDELFPDEVEDDPTEGNSSEAAPAATKLPQDMTNEELAQKAIHGENNEDDEESVSDPNESGKKLSVGVVVINDGKILCGTRMHDSGRGLICGPGGHIEEGETPVQAAFRETEEEFGISPKELIPLGYGPTEATSGLTPCVFLCTEYIGEPYTSSDEIKDPEFISLEDLELLSPSLFQPFKDGVELLMSSLKSGSAFDGGPGSGNFGHEGVPGKLGGSAPSASAANDRIHELVNGSTSRNEFFEKVEKISKQMPTGQKAEDSNGFIYTKTGDNEWTTSDKQGEVYEVSTDKDFAGHFSEKPFMEDYNPKFVETSSEEMTEQMLKAGELEAKDYPEVSSAEAIEAYQDYGYQSLNESLREGNELDEKSEFIDKGLQEAFDRAKATTSDTLVYRDSGAAITAEAFEKTGIDDVIRQHYGSDTVSLSDAWSNPDVRQAIKEKLIGYEFKEKGYCSTSSDYDSFKTFSEGNGNQDTISSFGCKETMRINVPKGSKVLDLGEDGYINGSGENEVIINKGGNFKISAVEYDYDTQSLALYCDYTSKRNTDGVSSTNTFISENPIDKSAQNSKIKVKNNNDEKDGSDEAVELLRNYILRQTKDSPNDNRSDYGVPGMKWGERKEQIKKNLVGKTTADGVKINAVTNHALDRIKGRGIKDSAINSLLTTNKTSPGNTSRTRCYEAKGVRMVLDTKKGVVVSVMKRRNNK